MKIRALLAVVALLGACAPATDGDHGGGYRPTMVSADSAGRAAG